MGAARPLPPGLRDEAHVGLVHDGGGLKGVVPTLAAQLPRGDAAQLVIDQGKRLLRRLLISRAPPLEKLCDRWFSHDPELCLLGPAPTPGCRPLARELHRRRWATRPGA